ncbi:MAG TPA: hypothetical protein VM163_00180 [bacterium]|nr:hypothetical protein [bacterium]
MKRAVILSVVLSLAIPLWAGKKDDVDPRLAHVKSIFVKGNNQAADKAREILRKGKTCFALASNPDEADAVLEMADSATPDTGIFGSMGARHNVVSGTLTLKSGDLIWSRSERFSDAPLMSGAKTAADILIHELAKDADCKKRKK